MALNLPIATQFNPQGVNDAKKAFLTLGQGVSKSSGVMGTAMGKLGGAIAGGFALHRLKAFAKETIHLAVENQRAQAMLDRQIQNSTKVTEEQLHANEEWIISQQFASGVGKNQLRPALAQLVRVTKDLNQSQTLLNLAMDVSAGTGKPLAQVSLALSRAYMGSTLALKKMGIQVKDASGKALSFDQIQQSLAKTFAGATATSAQTASGQLAIASLRFEEMKEAIGMNLLPVLQSLLATLMPIIIAFTAMPKGVQQVVTLMLVAGIAFKSATTALVGLEVAMATAQISMGVLIGVIAVATIAYTVLSGRKAEAKKVTQDLTTALLGEASATNEALAELASTNEGVMRFIEGQKQAGIATKDVSEYIKSGTGAMADFQTQVLGIADSTKGSQNELIAIAEAFNFDQDPKWADKASLIRDLAKETKKLRDEQTRIAGVQKLVGQVSGQTESDLAELGGETDDLTSDLKTLGDEWEATIKKFNEQDTMTGLAESLANVVVAGQKAFGSTSQADMANYQKELHSAYKTVHDYLITIENLPTKVETEIFAQLNRNDFAGALASLQAIPTTIGVDIVPHYGSADAMERQANSAGNSARQTIQGIIDALTEAKDTGGGVSATVKTFAEKFADLTATLQGYGTELRAVRDAHRAVLQAPKDLAIAITNTAKAQTHFNNVVNGFSKSSKEAREATRNLAQAQRDATRAGIGLADAQQAVIDAQKALTLLQTPASARSVGEAQDAITQATYNLADANKELGRAQRRNKPRELALAQIAQRDATNALVDAETALTTLQADADPQAVTDAQETLTQAQLDLTEAKLADSDATKDVKTAQDALNEIIDGAKKGTDAYTEAVDLLAEAKLNEATATDAVATSIIAEKDAKLALAKAERELIMSKKGMSKKQIAKAERQTGVISGNKAVGGSVQAGKSYIVGEMGREMFTPSANGTITPNNQMSQGSTIIVNVAGSVTSERNLVEAIRIGLINAQKSGKVLVV